MNIIVFFSIYCFNLARTSKLFHAANFEHMHVWSFIDKFGSLLLHVSGSKFLIVYCLKNISSLIYLIFLPVSEL